MRFFISLILMVCLFGVIPVFSQNNTGGTGSLAGTVTTGDSADPVAGAVVVLVSGGNQRKRPRFRCDRF